MKCTQCGHKVKPGKFCMHCGTLAEVPISPTPLEKSEAPNGEKTKTIAEDAPSTESTTIVSKKPLPIWVYILPVGIFLLAFIITFIALRSDFSLFGANKAALDERYSLIVRCGDDLYYVEGDETMQLSSDAEDIESIFTCVEQISDGTFFVVEDLEASDSPYEALTSDGGSYVVGDLVMISPDGERTKLDKDVYEMVFSLFDNVCYYQVIEENRQKICVVIDGETYDVSGWVHGNIDYHSGSPDGKRTYFVIVDDDEETACIGEDGDYEEVLQSDEFLFWLVSDEDAPIYVVEFEDDTYKISVVEDGEIIDSLPDAVDYDFNDENGSLVIQDTDGDLFLYKEYDDPIKLATGMDEDDQITFVQTQGVSTDWLLYSGGKKLYIADVSQSKIQPIRIGNVDDWKFILDMDTDYIYIKGDADALFTYDLGAEAAEEIEIDDDVADWSCIDGTEGYFYYITGDEDTYDYTEDTTDLYYYNGDEQILLIEDAEWYVGNVIVAFNDEKVLWRANGNLYMADADGDNSERILRDAWWVVKAGDDVYAISYDGELYQLDSNGDKTEIIDGVDSFLPYRVEW